MPIPLASSTALLALVLVSFQRPLPSSSELPDIGALVTRIVDSSTRDHADDVAALRASGVVGVQWLAEHAAEPGPRQAEAMSILRWFEPRGADVGAQIVPLLRHPDEPVRAWAALAMANTVPPVVDLLLTEFDVADRERRLAAVGAARAFVEHHERVAPKLAALVDDADEDVRYWATFSLGGLAPSSLPALFHALESDDARVRVAAAEGLQKAVYPFFTDRDASDWVGYSTWHGLPPEMGLRQQSNEIVVRDGLGVLGQALRDVAPDVRYFAAMTLYELGPRAVSVRSALESAREDASAGVRFWVARALERSDETPWRRLRQLAARLRKEGEVPVALNVQEMGTALADLERGREWATPQGTQRAWSEERDVRFEAVKTLAARALDEFVRDASKGSGKRAEAAVKALTSMERELDARLAKLIGILDDEWDAGGPAARALIELGPVAISALEHDMLRFPRFSMGPPTYVPTAGVLRELGDAALPTLAIGLGHWHELGRVFCTQEILAAGPRALPLVPSLLSAWRTIGADVRVPGSRSHWDVETERYLEECNGPTNVRGVRAIGAQVVPDLERALKDPHVLVRARAATALGSLARAAEPALGSLALALRDGQRVVALAAAEAIERIAAEGSPESRAARERRDELRAR